MARVLGGLLLVLALAGCSHAPISLQDSVDTAHTNYANALKAGNAQAVASLFAPDAVLVEATSPSTVKGQSAVAQFYDNLFRRAKILDVIIQQEAIQQDGHTAFETARYIVTLQPATGEPLARTTRHLTVWKLQSDGTWLIQADAAILQVPNPPPF